MSKLYICLNGTKIADGEGELDSVNEFEVAISHGSDELKQGKTYEIRKGQASSGDRYNCKAVKGSTAAFQRQASDFAATYQENTLRLRECLNSVKKQVAVEISEEDLTALKGCNYKLCFAKKIAEGDYNVVWQSFDSYLINNLFSWTPQYQLFGSNEFSEGVTVNVSTNLATIGLGETVTLTQAGVLQPPVSGGSPTAFTMHNEYGSIHVGVSQVCTQLDGKAISSPIYVSREAVLKGDIALTPVEKVLVWFQQDIATSTMFSTARTASLELDLTETNRVHCLFSRQAWKIVSQGLLI